MTARFGELWNGLVQGRFNDTPSDHVVTRCGMVLYDLTCSAFHSVCHAYKRLAVLAPFNALCFAQKRKRWRDRLQYYVDHCFIIQVLLQNLSDWVYYTWAVDALKLTKHLLPNFRSAPLDLDFKVNGSRSSFFFCSRNEIVTFYVSLSPRIKLNQLQPPKKYLLVKDNLIALVSDYTFARWQIASAEP